MCGKGMNFEEMINNMKELHNGWTRSKDVEHG